MGFLQAKDARVMIYKKPIVYIAQQKKHLRIMKVLIGDATPDMANRF